MSRNCNETPLGSPPGWWRGIHPGIAAPNIAAAAVHQTSIQQLLVQAYKSASQLLRKRCSSIR
jgi:hypothetical protein